MFACSYDGALNPWSKELWTKLLELHPLPEGKSLRTDELLPPTFTVTAVAPAAETKSKASAGRDTGGPKAMDLSGDDAPSSAPSSSTGPAALRVPDSRAAPPRLPPFGEGRARYTPHLARMLTNRRITHAKHGQDVRHIEFDIKGSGIRCACCVLACTS